MPRAKSQSNKFSEYEGIPWGVTKKLPPQRATNTCGGVIMTTLTRPRPWPHITLRLYPSTMVSVGQFNSYPPAFAPVMVSPCTKMLSPAVPRCCKVCEYGMNSLVIGCIMGFIELGCSACVTESFPLLTTSYNIVRRMALGSEFFFCL